MKLKYKYVKNNAFCKDLEFIDKGEMVDLYLPDNVEFKQNESKMLPQFFWLKGSYIADKLQSLSYL